MNEQSVRFRSTLQDLRAEMFNRFSLLAIGFSAFIGYTALLERPMVGSRIAIMGAVAFVLLLIHQWGQGHLQSARYAFVVMIHVGLGAMMATYASTWVPFMGVALTLMSALLVSHSSLPSATAIWLWAWWLNQGGAGYPMGALALALTVGGLTAMTAVSTFYTALMWYSSMYQRADELLNETRSRRADLLHALNSLETAYQTQRAMQQQLVEAKRRARDAQRLKEQFAANISHELRTPLNLIMGFSEMMYLQPEVYGEVQLPPKLYRDLSQIYRSSRHLLEMIDDVLDLSHVEMSGFALNVEQVDTNVFMCDVMSIIESLFQGHPAQLATDIAPDLPPLDIDRTRVRQVFINLINNARRFTQEGQVTVGADHVAGAVRFRVTDTGIGIPSEKLGKIFDEFYQVDYSLSRSYGGAGLGLAITRRFIEAHGGQIWVESVEGAGSTFWFTLPTDDAPPPLMGRESDGAARPVRVPIAIIERDAAVITLIQRRFPHLHLLPIANADTLPTLMQTHRPQAVIVNQPPNHPQPKLDGLSVPVIVCSLPSTHWFIDALGVRDSLAKPVTNEQIASVVAAVDGVERVLIVDDDMGFVQLVQRSIETLQRDYTILRAYDGAQALDVMRSHAVDLVLLDVAMPELDGFGVLDAMRNDPTLHDVPVILLTATRYIGDNGQGEASLTVHYQQGLAPVEVLRVLGGILSGFNIPPKPTP